MTKYVKDARAQPEVLANGLGAQLYDCESLFVIAFDCRSGDYSTELHQWAGNPGIFVESSALFYFHVNCFDCKNF